MDEPVSSPISVGISARFHQGSSLEQSNLEPDHISRSESNVQAVFNTQGEDLRCGQNNINGESDFVKIPQDTDSRSFDTAGRFGDSSAVEVQEVASPDRTKVTYGRTLTRPDIDDKTIEAARSVFEYRQPVKFSRPRTRGFGPVTDALQKFQKQDDDVGRTINEALTLTHSRSEPACDVRPEVNLEEPPPVVQDLCPLTRRPASNTAQPQDVEQNLTIHRVAPVAHSDTAQGFTQCRRAESHDLLSVDYVVDPSVEESYASAVVAEPAKTTEPQSESYDETEMASRIPDGEPAPSNATPVTSALSNNAKDLPSALRPVRHHNRIQNCRSKSQGSKSVAKTTDNRVLQPSEEDLLLLLMKRSRERLGFSEKAIARQTDLETQIAQLRNDNIKMSKEFDHVSSDLESSQKNNDLMLLQLTTFKDKYKKLKTWALKMTESYAELRRGADDLNTSLTSLRKDGDCLVSSLKETQRSHDQVSLTVGSIVRELPGVKSRNEHLVQELANKDQFLLSEQSRLQQERHWSEEQAERFSQLDKSQQQMNGEITKLQQAVLQNLNSISQELSRGNNHNELFSKTETQLSTIQRAIEESTNTDSLRQVSTTLTNVLSTLKEASSSVSELKMRFTSAQKTVTGGFEQVGLRIASLQPRFDLSVSLNERQAELEERIKSNEQVHRVIEEAKVQAELREVALRKANETLLDRLREDRNHGDDQSSQMIQNLQTKNGELTLKYVSAESARRVSEQNLLEMEDKMKNLSEVLAQKTELEAELCSLKRETQKHKDDMDANTKALCLTEAKFEDENQRRLELESRLQNYQRELVTKTRDFGETLRVKDRLEQQLSELQQKTQSDETEMRKLEKQICEDRESITRANEEAKQNARVWDEQNLRHRNDLVELSMARQKLAIHEADTKELELLKPKVRHMDEEIAQLRTQVTSQEETIEEHAAMRSQAMQMQGELEALRLKLAPLETDSKEFMSLQTESKKTKAELNTLRQQISHEKLESPELEKMKMELKNKNEEMLTLSLKLEKAQRNSRLVDDLQEQITILRFEYENIRLRLVDAEATAARVPELEAEIERHRTAVHAHKDEVEEAGKLRLDIHELDIRRSQLAKQLVDKSGELKEAKKQCEQVLALKEKVHRNDEAIANMTKKLTEAIDACRDYELLKTESQRKDVELVGLQEHVLRLEQESQQTSGIDDFWEKTHHDLMDGFFGQPTNLSLETSTIGSQARLRSTGEAVDVRTIEPFTDCGTDAPPEPVVEQTCSTQFSGLDTQDLAQLDVVDDNKSSSGATDFVPESQIADKGLHMYATKSKGHSTELGDMCIVFESGRQRPDDVQRTPVEDFSVQIEKHGIDVDSKQAGCEPASQDGTTSRGKSNQQDELLLPSSNSSSRDKPSRQRLPNDDQSNGMAATRLAPTRTRQAVGTSELRSESSSRQWPLALPPPRPLATRTPSVPSPTDGSRERYQPNSAAKRRVEIQVPASSAERGSKRPRRSEAEILNSYHPATPLGPANTRPMDTRMDTHANNNANSYNTPYMGRTRSSMNSNNQNPAPPGGRGRKAKSARRGSRQDRYSQRFS